MMKYSLYILLMIFFVSCSSKSEKLQQNSDIYSVNITSMIDDEIHYINDSVKTACKYIMMSGSGAEQKTIDPAHLKSDLEFMKEYDINKSAWKNSFKETQGSGFYQYSTTENSIPVKTITVFGDLKQPQRIRIYVQNLNNLYESAKVIEINPKKSYSIFSIQNVKGMNADTLFIKTKYQNCETAEATSFAGK